MKRGWWVWVLAALLIILLLPANPFNLSTVRLTVPTGATARSVSTRLKQEGILPAYSPFFLVVRLLGIQNQLKAGDYLFSPSDPLPRVILKLWSGETAPPTEIAATFPEGASIYKMGVLLKEYGYRDWREFQGLVSEGITPARRERHRKIFRYISSESLEGYLFPDTYRLFADSHVEVLVEVMIKRFEAVVLPYWESARRNTTLNLHEIITLASIVEKEAKLPEERAIIAAVFHNRLQLGMPLAADPTIKYALERPSKVVYLDQLSVRSPYNTYKRRGLPPGPICNPGLESIKAAVQPARTGYFFFVARKDGSHIFSKTWQEHQKAKFLVK